MGTSKSKKGLVIILLVIAALAAAFYFLSPKILPQSNLAISEKGGKFGLVNANKRTVVPYKFDRIDKNGEIFTVESNGKYGLYDSHGKIIAPCEYDNVKFVSDRGILSKGGKSFLVDGKGSKIGTEHDALEFLQNGYVKVTDNGLSGAVDRDGKQIVPCSYKDIIISDEPLKYAIVTAENGLKGIVMESSTIPCEYDDIKGCKKDDKNGEYYFSVKKNGMLSRLDTSGKQIGTSIPEWLEGVWSKRMYVGGLGPDYDPTAYKQLSVEISGDTYTMKLGNDVQSSGQYECLDIGSEAGAFGFLGVNASDKKLKYRSRDGRYLYLIVNMRTRQMYLQEQFNEESFPELLKMG